MIGNISRILNLTQEIFIFVVKNLFYENRQLQFFNVQYLRMIFTFIHKFCDTYIHFFMHYEKEIFRRMLRIIKLQIWNK